jgi:RNA polymerase sigma-70 factor (ECF subfamily)
LNNQKIRDQLYQASVAKEYLSSGNTEFDELKEKIESIIDELPARQRDIFKLSRYDGLSHKEIAEKLNITTKTVEYHISQAITYIKGKLKALGLISLLYFYLLY